MNRIIKCTPKSPSPCHCLNLRRASRAVTHFYDKVMEPSGLKITQYSFLRNLERVESVSISILAKNMNIDRTTLNRNMKPLMSAGLISINTGKDSRSKLVTLTKDGKATLADAMVLWGEAQTSLEKYFGEEGLDGFEKLLAKLESLA